MPRHVVLAGDSIFDNAAYIVGAPDVAKQLRGILPSGDAVTLLAVDGSICEHVHAQIEHLPKGATHLVISSGGNDILHHSALLQQPVETVAAALAMLADARAELAEQHRLLVEAAVRHRIPVAFCTIYFANMGPLIAAAMSLFNDAITRNIHAAGCDLLDLRLVATVATDYANPIEPSAAGGAKIAAAIKRYALEIDTRSPQSRVFF